MNDTDRWNWVCVCLCVVFGLATACGAPASEPDAVSASSTTASPAVPSTVATIEDAAAPSVPSTAERAPSPFADSPPVTAAATGDELESAGIRFGPLAEGFLAWGEAEHSDAFGEGTVQESQEYRDLDQIRSVSVAILTGVPTERLIADASGEPTRQLSPRSVEGYETYPLDLTRVSQQLQLSFAVDEATMVFLSGYNMTWDELFDLADTFEVQQSAEREDLP